jgi:hypothetical protein
VLQVGHVSPRGIELDEMGTTGETSPVLDVGVPPVLAVTCGVAWRQRDAAGKGIVAKMPGVRREPSPWPKMKGGKR